MTTHARIVVLIMGANDNTASLSNVASRFLVGLDPRDPRAYVVAMITLLAAAFAATMLPARHAASIDSITALRQEQGPKIFFGALVHSGVGLAT